MLEGGKKRDRCIEMLRALGIRVHYCIAAQGHWKKKRADVMAWEFGGTFNGMTVTGGCWETMTECAKALRLSWNRKTGEVWPEGKKGARGKKP